MEAARERESPDVGLVVVTLTLIALGAIIILDASFARALQSRDAQFDAFHYFKRQVLWISLAAPALWVSCQWPYWRLRRWPIWLGGVVLAIILLVVVLIPTVGREGMGSRRWLGFGPARFQPSEFAKVAMVLFLARYSELCRGCIRQLVPGFVLPAGVICVLGALIAVEDLGTAITLVVTGLIMLVMMGAQLRHMGGLIGGMAVLGLLAILAKGYRMRRVAAWATLLVSPLTPQQGDAYQPWQGLIALGSGGVFGQGIMKGNAKHLYLPAERTDYILATVGEEGGLVLTLALLAIFVAFLIRGLTIAHRCQDWFGSLLAAGLTTGIGVQAILNIAVVLALVPCTGLPLPFISYGGSSLLFTAISAGLILSVSQWPGGAPVRAGRRPTAEGTGPPEGSGAREREHASTPDRGRNRRAHLSGA